MAKQIQVDGLLIDLDGVLYIESNPVPGAKSVVDELNRLSIPKRFITNTTTNTAKDIADKLQGLGFCVTEHEIFSPIDACVNYLSTKGSPTINPILNKNVLGSFSSFRTNRATPEYIVIGDIGNQWSYDLMNRLFTQLHNGAKLIALHKNKFFQTDLGLKLDIGAFISGLEYAVDKKSLVIGKPSIDFFDLAIRSLGCKAENLAMIGDDIKSDVQGAMKVGLFGILVKTGKYRKGQENKSKPYPDACIESIANLFDVCEFNV